MADNGAGSYTLPQPPFTSGTTISSAAVNSNFSDLATGLNNRLTRNGENAASANLPMAGFRHTGVGDANARTQYVSAGQLVDGALVWGGSAGGTANALTISPAIGISAYATGQRFQLYAPSTNTAAVTLAVSGLTAKAILRHDGVTPLAAGDIVAGSIYDVIYDSVQFRLLGSDAPGWRVLNRTVFSSAQGSIVFTLPTTSTRFRLEYEELSATAAAPLIMRFSYDGGSTYASGASDYATVFNLLKSSANTASVLTAAYAQLAGTTPAGSAVFGAVEFQSGGSRMWSSTTTLFETTGSSALSLCTATGQCYASLPTTATNVLLAFASTTAAAGRLRLLGAS